MEKKYKFIGTFTVKSLYDIREVWPDDFEFTFEELLDDICSNGHTGIFEDIDDVCHSSLYLPEVLDFLAKLGWIEELPVKENKKDIKLTVGSTVKGISAYEEDEATYIYALVYGHPHSPKFNLVNIYTGGRYFEDGELGRSCTLDELNEKSSGLTTFVKLD